MAREVVYAAPPRPSIWRRGRWKFKLPLYRLTLSNPLRANEPAGAPGAISTGVKPSTGLVAWAPAGPARRMAIKSSAGEIRLPPCSLPELVEDFVAMKSLTMVREGR